jgi:hypothetical protein
MAELCGASISTVETIDSSRALAAGSRVPIKSREEEMPRIAIDFALFEAEFISVLLPFSSPVGTHPPGTYPCSSHGQSASNEAD